MRKLFRLLDKHRTASNVFVVILGISFFMFLSNLTPFVDAMGTLYSYVATLVAGCAIAYILHPICALFEYRVFKKMKNRKAARSLGVLCCIVSTLAAIALLMWAIIPEIISSGATLIDNMDGYISAFSARLVSIQESIPYIDINIEEIIGDWTEIVGAVTTWITDNVTNILDYTVNIGAGIFDGLVAFVLSIYILLDRRNLMRAIKRFFHAMLRPDRFASFRNFAKGSNEILKNYLGGNIIDSFIIGILNYIYLLCVGSPNAGLLAVLNGITNFIPTFGPIIGLVPSAFIILLTEENGATKALWFLIFTVIIQQFDANVFKPILFGNAAGIAPVFVLASITVFGRMFGFLGMLLGVPIFAILMLAYNNFIANRFRVREIEDVYHSVREEESKESWMRKLVDFMQRKGIKLPFMSKSKSTDTDNSSTKKK